MYNKTLEMLIQALQLAQEQTAQIAELLSKANQVINNSNHTHNHERTTIHSAESIHPQG